MSHINTKQYFLFKGVIGYRRLMKLQNTSGLLKSHPEVEERLKTLKFFDKYGLSATKDAFGISRSTIYLWKKRLREKGLWGLANQSRRPYNTRKMYVHPLIHDFIKDLREKYPRLGKDKIKVLLDEYLQDKKDIQTISASKIGKIIRRNNWFFYLGKRNKKRLSLSKKRVFGYQVKQPGDLFQVDTIVRFEHGIKRYIYSAIDVVSKFSFAYTYKTNSSRSASDFVDKLFQVTPYPIKAIQTDNGSEYLKLFDQELRKRGVVHFFTYPRCPKQNGSVERLNRTIQEEFVEAHRELLEYPNTKDFNNLLIDYLLFYNTKRPHHSLNLKTPMHHVVNYLKKSNMCGTSTQIGNLALALI